MTPERVFAKLAARVPPMVNMGGSTGAPEIDMPTAAALCAGMGDEAFNAGLAAFALCPEAIEKTRITLHMRAMELSQRRWHDKAWARLAEKIKAHTGQPASIVLANIAVSEMLYPHQWNHSLRASVLGVPQSTYHRHVAGRYKEVAAYLDAWTETARAHVVRAQRD